MPIERTQWCTWRPLWQEYPVLTSTTILFGRGKPAGGIQRYRANGDGLSDRAYGATDITDMDWATGSIYLGDPGVDRHHLIIWNTQSIILSYWSQACLPSFHISMQFVRFLTLSCRTFIDPRNLCGCLWPGTPSYPLTLFLHSSSQNRSFSPIAFRCRESSTISPHRDWVSSVMHLEAEIEWTQTCTSRPEST